MKLYFVHTYKDNLYYNYSNERAELFDTILKNVREKVDHRFVITHHYALTRTHQFFRHLPHKVAYVTIRFDNKIKDQTKH